jgi:hypothetical protein
MKNSTGGSGEAGLGSRIDEMDDLLRNLPEPALSQPTRERTLALARAHVVPARDASPLRVLAQIPAHAVPALLLSADVAFAADTCVKLSRAFGSDGG